MKVAAASAIALALIGLSLGSASAAVAAPPQTTLPELEDEVMCPICGTLLSLSRAPAAQRERVFIRRLIAQGKSRQEIKDALVAEYGPQVLALPDSKGFNIFAYLVPVLVFMAGGLIVVFAITGRRRNRSREDDPEVRDPEPGPDGEDSDRLDRDMAEFDL